MTIFDGMKWDLGTAGPPLRSSVRNANLGLQEIGWKPPLLSVKDYGLPTVHLQNLAEEVEQVCKFRPTIKALRVAVKQLSNGNFVPQDKRGDRAPKRPAPRGYDICVRCGAQTAPRWALQFADGDIAPVCKGCYEEQGGGECS